MHLFFITKVFSLSFESLDSVSHSLQKYVKGKEAMTFLVCWLLNRLFVKDVLKK